MRAVGNRCTKDNSGTELDIDTLELARTTDLLLQASSERPCEVWKSGNPPPSDMGAPFRGARKVRKDWRTNTSRQRDVRTSSLILCAGIFAKERGPTWSSSPKHGPTIHLCAGVLAESGPPTGPSTSYARELCLFAMFERIITASMSCPVRPAVCRWPSSPAAREHRPRHCPLFVFARQNHDFGTRIVLPSCCRLNFVLKL